MRVSFFLILIDRNMISVISIRFRVIFAFCLILDVLILAQLHVWFDKEIRYIDKLMLLTWVLCFAKIWFFCRILEIFKLVKPNGRLILSASITNFGIKWSWNQFSKRVLIHSGVTSLLLICILHYSKHALNCNRCISTHASIALINIIIF